MTSRDKAFRIWFLAAVVYVIGVLGLSFYARAQSPSLPLTTLTGTIRDTTGAVVTSGRIAFTTTLSGTQDATIPGVARFVPTTTYCSISGAGSPVSSSGSGPCTVVSNTALSPAGTSYTVCIQPYNVSPGGCFNFFALTQTVDISTVAPTPGKLPTNFTGVQGPIGQGLLWRGTYNPLTPYAVGDAVYFQGAAYIALQANSNASPQQPNISPTVWGPIDPGAALDVRLFGAKEDGVTDDTAALNTAATTARALNGGGTLYLPPGIFQVSDTIDFRLLHVYGAGMYQTTIRMGSGVKKSVVYISLNTVVEKFGVIGGWDRTTTGAYGAGFEATTSEPGSTAQLPYHMTIKDVSSQNTFGPSLYLIDAAYTLVSNFDFHNSGGAAIIHIDSHDNPNVDGFGPTTITLENGTASDTYGSVAPAILDNDCVNCRFENIVMENTGGGKTIGPQNRALSINGCYEENTSTGQFWQFYGSAGLGLSMHGNRGGPIGGPAPGDLVVWRDWDIKGNWFSVNSVGDSGFPSTIQPVSSFFDPVVTHITGEFIMNPGVQTQISAAVTNSSAGWAAKLHGTFVDFTGGLAAIPPDLIITSAFPTVGFGHGSLTFSLSSSGALQATVTGNCCGATTIRFLGSIDFFPDRNHAGSQFALVTPAQIYAGTYYGATLSLTGAAAAATVQATGGFLAPDGSSGYTGDITIGTSTIHVKGGIVTGVN